MKISNKFKTEITNEYNLSESEFAVLEVVFQHAETIDVKDAPKMTIAMFGEQFSRKEVINALKSLIDKNILKSHKFDDYSNDERKYFIRDNVKRMYLSNMESIDDMLDVLGGGYRTTRDELKIIYDDFTKLPIQLRNILYENFNGNAIFEWWHGCTKEELLKSYTLDAFRQLYDNDAKDVNQVLIKYEHFYDIPENKQELFWVRKGMQYNDYVKWWEQARNRVMEKLNMPF